MIKARPGRGVTALVREKASEGVSGRVPWGSGLLGKGADCRWRMSLGGGVEGFQTLPTEDQWFRG